jgi:hypothetical protein
MPPIRIDQSLAITVLRPLTKKHNIIFTIQNKSSPALQQIQRRCASTKAIEPERPSIVHHTSPVNSDFHHYEQRREVSTSDLDKSRDRRERVVILGSGD